MAERRSRLIQLAWPVLALIVTAPQAQAQHGVASWYRARPSHARYTVAHRTAPLGSHVRVCRPRHGCVIALVTDRGPHAKGRIVDLNRAAARALGVKGVAPVSVAPVR